MSQPPGNPFERDMRKSWENWKGVAASRSVPEFKNLAMKPFYLAQDHLESLMVSPASYEFDLATRANLDGIPPEQVRAFDQAQLKTLKERIKEYETRDMTEVYELVDDLWNFINAYLMGKQETGDEFDLEAVAQEISEKRVQLVQRIKKERLIIRELWILKELRWLQICRPLVY